MLDLLAAGLAKARPRDSLCRPLGGDSMSCNPDGIARRMGAGEPVSVRELPAPRHPALSTLGFAPASYPSRPRDAPVRPGGCCGTDFAVTPACTSMALQKTGGLAGAVSPFSMDLSDRVTCGSGRQCIPHACTKAFTGKHQTHMCCRQHCLASCVALPALLQAIISRFGCLPVLGSVHRVL